MALLDLIDSPSDLKTIPKSDLPKLAAEIRSRIIDVVARNGGHLAPNLGVVELTIALHLAFDAPEDRIVWDVGHQAYAHKLLTGRRKRFHTLRRHGGLSGFPRRQESEYDVFNVGHAGTSISAALGIACARDNAKEDFSVVAVIGDGALGAGIAFEALNQVGHLKKNMVIVLNDNRMSISKNVGALSHYLTTLITAPIYNEFRKDVWELMGKLPRSLEGRAKVLAKRIEEGLKNLVLPGILFEELGLRYIGPIDGHNIDEMAKTLRAAKRLRGPILVHLLTEKGKGYRPAEENLPRFHGLGPFDVDTGTPIKTKGAPTYTEVFGKTLIQLAAEDERIVAITAAMAEGTGLTEFAKRFPRRFHDVGIAEQHAVTFAAGLALRGLRPVAAIYSTFLQRAFDQVIHDVALQQLPVVFAMDRGGLVGEDGPTHHGTFDLSYLRLIPNIVVMAPKDENELRRMLKTAICYGKGPVAIRYPRGRGVGVPLEYRIRKIRMGKAETLRQGKDVAILAVGAMVHPALQTADLLAKRGIEAGVVNARFVKPIDTCLIGDLLENVPCLVTLEENVRPGGFGSAVLEYAAAIGHSRARIDTIGLPDEFIEHGARSKLLEHCGLTPEQIADRVLRFAQERGKEAGRRVGADRPAAQKRGGRKIASFVDR
ncbi:1-deoxy-D-xylulose-5-phosphate synthase [candidate division TA06 bacterium SM1_40]|uniref:1-deoxy-D-xylulose-5-phosphate synthase n=2 Tax=Bacteria division TA06 TaxID=1156500 RepID=A0A0S8JL06_UNCT6|nr:MAG: 1-deoxy-D-xylulose-5-phosphate synthase [candidate division TA06 bacterium SM23_40]KPL10050.1 MAG: 1-deoxy-D-xylulose-5-phosphate synthase [candidate division TA06 bacterium SM1_40]